MFTATVPRGVWSRTRVLHKQNNYRCLAFTENAYYILPLLKTASTSWSGSSPTEGNTFVSRHIVFSTSHIFWYHTVNSRKYKTQGVALLKGSASLRRERLRTRVYSPAPMLGKSQSSSYIRIVEFSFLSIAFLIGFLWSASKWTREHFVI